MLRSGLLVFLVLCIGSEVAASGICTRQRHNYRVGTRSVQRYRHDYYSTRCGVFRRCRRSRRRSYVGYTTFTQVVYWAEQYCCPGYEGSPPSCIPICDPPCLNGGTCTAPQRCQCPSPWFGPTCDQDLTAMVNSTTSTTISLSWNAPINLTVDNYVVMWVRDISGECLDEDQGNAIVTNGSTSYTITQLEEDSNYTITVANSAWDVVSDHVTGMTEEGAPSAPPTFVNASDVTSFSVTVQWGAVDCIHRNGDITGYSVRYATENSTNTQIEKVSGEVTSEVTLSGLLPSTTYTIGVAAENSAGTGEYSEGLSVLTAALTNITIVVADYEKYAVQYDEYIEIEVSWSPVLLGTNTFNKISYYTMQDRLIFQLSEELPGNTTSFTRVIRDPYQGLQHVFTVMSVVKTQNITYEGPEANKSIVIDKAYFQLQFGSVDHCITWTSEHAEVIESKLQFEIKEAIYKNCYICRQFSRFFLRRGVFICQSSPTMATYRSTLFNTNIPGLSNASSLVSYVQDWVATGPVVRLNWLLVRINKDSPVAIQQLSDPECPLPHSLQPELVNHINGVMNTCAARHLGSQVCQI